MINGRCRNRKKNKPGKIQQKFDTDRWRSVSNLSPQSDDGALHRVDTPLSRPAWVKQNPRPTMAQHQDDDTNIDKNKYKPKFLAILIKI